MLSCIEKTSPVEGIPQTDVFFCQEKGIRNTMFTPDFPYGGTRQAPASLHIQ